MDLEELERILAADTRKPEYGPGRQSLNRMQVKVKYYPPTRLRHLVLLMLEERRQTYRGYYEIPLEFTEDEALDFLLKHAISYRVDFKALSEEVGKWHAKELIAKRVYRALLKAYPEYRYTITERQKQELAWYRLQKKRKH